MFNIKTEKILTIIAILLTIFIIGVQIGIHHGRKLEKQEHYEYIYSN